MFSFIAKLTLRSIFRLNSTGRQKKFLPWEKIDKIAIIINKDASVNKSAIDTFIDDTKKYIEVFYIELRSKEPSFGDWQCFSKKDKSFFNLPTKSVMSILKDKKYDVVINTCNSSNLYAAAVSLSLDASFKCASSSRLLDADLIIRKTGHNNLLAFLNDTVHYLKMIRV